MIYALIASVFWGAWSFFYKKASNGAPVAELQFYNACFFLIQIPIFFFYLRSVGTPPTFNKGTILWTLAANISASIAAFLFIYSIKNTTNISAVTAISSSYPIFTLLLAALFIGESITLAKMCGLALIAGGIFMLK